MDGHNKEPASRKAAEDERQRIVNEIIELDAWFAGVGVASVSSQDYHRQRAKRIARKTWLQRRASFLKRWLAQHGGVQGMSPMHTLLGRAYHFLSRLEPEALGTEGEKLLDDIEEFLPPSVLTRTIDADVPARD